MICIHKKLNPIHAISFDLDDTLYDNRPIILGALKAQQHALKAYPEWQQQGAEFWSTCRSNVIKQQPDLASDMTLLRITALKYGFNQLGFSPTAAETAALDVFNAFISARNRITVADSVLALLDKLKSHVPLIAITNGNVDITQHPLHSRFTNVLRAGPDGIAKPDMALYHKACQHLGIKPKHLLHVGDSLDSDVQGAHNAGVMSAWLKNEWVKYRYHGVPHITLTDIHALGELF